MDHYADDLAALTEALDLKKAIHVGHSTGGGEVARYVGRHGVKRVAKVVLIGAVTPIMVKTKWNPNGVPMGVFDGLREGVQQNRAQLFKEFPAAFYGFNRPGAKAFSETDLREDVKKITVPCLVLHGDDDQVVPLETTGKVAVTLLPRGTLQIVKGAPHGMCTTHKDQINEALLAFIKGSID